MGSTAARHLPYPELGDPPNVPADMKRLADAIDPLLNTAVIQASTAVAATAQTVGDGTPLAIRTGFLQLAPSGAHTAGSVYVVEVATGLTAITSFLATIRARSPLSPGWTASPGAGTGQETTVTVQTISGKPGSMYVSIFHPQAVNYTGGYGGVYWLAIGTA